MDFKQIKDVISTRCPDSFTIIKDKEVLFIKSNNWGDVSKTLNHDADLTFDVLLSITGYDTGSLLGSAYNFFSMDKRHYIEVRIEVERKNAIIPSVVGIWRTADWHEREVYDLFGITYEGHPDLRRILLPSDWEGYPLRKDFKEPEFYNGLPVPKDKTYWE